MLNPDLAKRLLKESVSMTAEKDISKKDCEKLLLSSPGEVYKALQKA
jgi:hypothetical protein